jgi:hypothetical protein
MLVAILGFFVHEGIGIFKGKVYVCVKLLLSFDQIYK